MTCNILATGSTGNAVVIGGEILVDCGVPMKKLRESGYIKDLKMVLLTHSHSDHFCKSTVRALHKERPALWWVCREWMVQPLLDAGVSKRVIYVLDGDEQACHFSFGWSVYATETPHDVRNCAWHLYYGHERLLYATDCGTMDGVTAPGYDYYLLEANHTKAEIEARVKDKLERGEFAYEYRAARNHLSQEQAMDWLAKNMGPTSKVVFLHQHKNKEE